MNPLTKVRDGAGAAASRIRSLTRRARGGTARTAGWATGGLGRAWRRARRAVVETTASAGDRIGEAAWGAWERSGGARLVDSARANPRIAIAWVVGGLLVVCWIAWAAYVSTERGVNAGVGVLVSWPAVFAALALIAAPFVGTYLLVRRLRGEGEPAVGGGEPPASDTEAATTGTYPG